MEDAPRSDSAHGLFVELLEQTFLSESERLASGLPPGSFVKKEVRGRVYWYLQVSEGDRKRQIYLGPSTETLVAQLEDWRRLKRDRRADDARRAELVRMLRAARVDTVPGSVATVLRALAGSGVFRLGGVLIGTRAFQAYAPMLGVRWRRRTAATQDIDIAQEQAIGVAIDPGVDVPAALDALGLGFHAVPKLDPRTPSTSFKVRGRDLRVDFLTPMIGPETDKPIYLPALQVAAQPIRFLDYLIDQPIDSVIVARRGIPVRLPDPGRFALHKLWTAQRRPPDQHLRARKDLAQAEQLLDFLATERQGDIAAAWRALDRHPKQRDEIDGMLKNRIDDAIATRVRASIEGD